jgi:hypothetical protein
VLGEGDLIASASQQGQDHPLAIAQRETISEKVTDILIERGEQKVVHGVAKNAGARISDDGFGKLVLRSGPMASARSMSAPGVTSPGIIPEAARSRIGLGVQKRSSAEAWKAGSLDVPSVASIGARGSIVMPLSGTPPTICRGTRPRLNQPT